MTVTGIVKLGRRADASSMADLADAKRRRYAEHAFPFQRPAERAREIHEPFLASLTDTEDFIVLVHQAAGAVDGFLVARLGAAPAPFGEGPHVHVDDYGDSAPSSARRRRCTTRAGPHALRSRSTDRSTWVRSRGSLPLRDRWSSSSLRRRTVPTSAVS
jgi:hypothetical protein